MDSDYIAKGINVSCRTIDSEAFIFDEDSHNLIKLDRVGSFIWDQINGKKTVGEILDICCQEFTGDAEYIRNTIREFIDNLQENNIVVLAEKAFEEVMTSAC